MRNGASALFAVLLAAAGLSGAAYPAGPAQTTVAKPAQTFATAAEAAAALVDALRGEKLDAIESVLGPGSAKLVSSGDKVSDAAERKRFSTAYDEQHDLVPDGPDRMTLQVGKDKWPLPIPLVQANGRWYFDSEAGAQEIINRRIGRNEIAAIRTALAYVDAQKEFYAMTGENGTAQYAQRLVSTPGKHDGLYWVAAEGEGESPLAPLVAQAREEGYPGANVSGKPQPYHGYYFRILTAQGADTPEGAINYVKDGMMTGGFGLIASPATYGASGIMTFIVNQNGIVYQKDLGPQTVSIVAATKLFDPDLTWARVEIVD